MLKNKETGKSAHLKGNNIVSSLIPKDNAGASKVIAPTLQEKSRLEVSHSTSIHWGKDQVGHIKTRPTKTNRAFMLRQQMNTKNDGRDLSETGNKVTNSVATQEGGISRFGVGRHSARKPKGKHQRQEFTGRMKFLAVLNYLAPFTQTTVISYR